MKLREIIISAQTYLSPKDVQCVVYHHPCNDGAGAALSAWLERGEDIEYLPLEYQQVITPEMEDKLRDKNVIFIDISVRKPVFDKLKGLTKKLVVLDHHESAMKELGEEPGCFFTMENAGAILAWHYFNGVEKPAPRLLQLLEDRDLWRWDERDLSEPLHYALVDLHPKNEFRGYAKYLVSHELVKVIAYGKTLVASNNAWCAAEALKATLRTITPPNSSKTYEVVCAQLENDKLISELADYLHHNNKVDFVMLWFKKEDGKFKISFRNQTTDENVATIARIYGGGGHPRAAGATVDVSPFELLDKPLAKKARLTFI
jgi:oligoribonuclease NrnB/cAMP/cGMP phosphodiesterase (DHH superfamily)